VQGPEAYAAYLTEDFLPILQAPHDRLVAAMGGLLTPVDAAAFTDDLGAFLARETKAAGAAPDPIAAATATDTAGAAQEAGPAAANGKPVRG